MTSYVVIGGGIVGLATARAIGRQDPAAAVTVLEKETELATHQTGRNSGVIHSGIYYVPGSAKALMCRAGAASMTAFAETHGIEVIRTGKLIVATSEKELPGLEKLYQRGLANDVPVSRISPEQAREHEPFVSCIAALHVASTAITDYAAVCRALAEDVIAAGGTIRLGTLVTAINRHADSSVLSTSAGEITADLVINCAGLQSDRMAALDPDGVPGKPDSQIVPFRGEYYELRPDRAHLVKGLIYPVPDPDFPFLGVHLTRMVDGSVHAGPNAVLALAREGYNWRTIRPADVASVVRFPGFWHLARQNFGPGMMEVSRSLSKKRFAASLARLVPDITADDLVPGKSGVRAQALKRDGGLVDDFLIARRGRNVHVLNAPSPAATSSLEIGDHIAGLAVRRDR
jgi:L-2-hydroxyglutarate oxidase